MSYKKHLSSSRGQLINPQATYEHVERLHNLLEQYDRQNQYLNKQVLQLLDRKHALDTKYSIVQNKSAIGSKNRQNVIQSSARATKGIGNRDIKDSRTKKKKYEYVDEEDEEVSMNYAKQNATQTSTQKSGQRGHKYQYATPIDRLVTNIYGKNNENGARDGGNIVSKSFKAVPESAVINNSSNIKKQTNNKVPSQEKLKDSNVLTQVRVEQHQNRLTNLTRNQTTNIVPILKKEPYIRSSRNNSCSFSNSPDQKETSPGRQADLNDSKFSGKSQRSSRKSGIHVTTSNKNLLEELRNSNCKSIQNKQYEQIKQGQNKIQTSPNKSIKRVSFTYQKQPKLTQSIIKPQVVNSTQSVQEQKMLVISGQQLKETATFKPLDLTEFIKKQQKRFIPIIIEKIEQRPYSMKSSIYRQFGVNTSPKQSTILARNRSMSQHRILPSEKISYPQQSQIKRKQSQPQLRSNSRETRDGKKKFLNLVSTSLLVKKLAQNQKLNDAYK